MRYLGDGEEEALSILADNDVVWRHVSCANLVKRLAKEQRLRVYGVIREGRASVVKYSTRERTEEALEQITAESRAAMLLSREHPHPLLVLPLKTIIDPDVGSFSIVPYAGVSAAVMRKRVWVNLEVSEYEKICQTFVVSALLTQRMFYGSAADGRRRFLHKDIKLENTCYNAEYNIFRFVDYGAFSSVDQKQWANCLDLRYLDPQMAQYYPERDLFAAETDSGVRATISHTTDIFLTGLAVVKLFLGHLPAKIDLANYDGNTRAYLKAVWKFRWDNCDELSTMPESMKSWVLKALAFDPKDRFQSASYAMVHPWIKKAVWPVVEALSKATPGWWQLVQDLKQDLKADTSSPGGGDSYTTSVLSPDSSDLYADFFLPSSAAVSESYSGSSIADGATCSQAVDSECEGDEHYMYEDDEEYEDDQEHGAAQHLQQHDEEYEDDERDIDDEEYGVAQHLQQHFEQYDGDDVAAIADCDSNDSGSTNSGCDCCGADEAAHMQSSSCPLAAPPSAGAAQLQYSVVMMPTARLNLQTADDCCDNGDSKPAARQAVSNINSVLRTGVQIATEEVNARAENCSLSCTSGAAVSAGLCEHLVYLSPSVLQPGDRLNSSNGSNIAAAGASSGASSAGCSNTATGCGTYAAQWHVDGLDGSNLDQAGVYSNVMPASAFNVEWSEHQHLVPSPYGSNSGDGSTRTNAAAANDPVMRPLEGLPIYRSISPAPKVDLCYYRNGQGLTSVAGFQRLV